MYKVHRQWGKFVKFHAYGGQDATPEVPHAQKVLMYPLMSPCILLVPYVLWIAPGLSLPNTVELLNSPCIFGTTFTMNSS